MANDFLNREITPNLTCFSSLNDFTISNYFFAFPISCIGVCLLVLVINYCINLMFQKYSVPFKAILRLVIW